MKKLIVFLLRIIVLVFFGAIAYGIVKNPNLKDLPMYVGASAIFYYIWLLIGILNEPSNEIAQKLPSSAKKMKKWALVAATCVLIYQLINLVVGRA